MSTPHPASQAELLAKQFLNEDEVCALLHVTPRTLENWYGKRLGPPRVKIGRTVLYRVASLMSWLVVHERKQSRINRKRIQIRRQAVSR
jgi:hypothetical protein